MTEMNGVDQVTLRRRKTGLTARDAGKSAGGITLYAPQTGDGAVYLVDEEGKRIHSWKLPVRPGRDAVLLKNGNLGFNGSSQTSKPPYTIWPLWRGGAFYEVDRDSKVVWSFNDDTHHHDARWLDKLVTATSTSTAVPSAMQRSMVTSCAAGRANDATERHKIAIDVTISATTTAMAATTGGRQRRRGRVVAVPKGSTRRMPSSATSAVQRVPSNQRWSCRPSGSGCQPGWLVTRARYRRSDGDRVRPSWSARVGTRWIGRW